MVFGGKAIASSYTWNTLHQNLITRVFLAFWETLQGQKCPIKTTMMNCWISSLYWRPRFCASSYLSVFSQNASQLSSNQSHPLMFLSASHVWIFLTFPEALCRTHYPSFAFASHSLSLITRYYSSYLSLNKKKSLCEFSAFVIAPSCVSWLVADWQPSCACQLQVEIRISTTEVLGSSRNWTSWTLMDCLLSERISRRKTHFTGSLFHNQDWI